MKNTFMAMKTLGTQQSWISWAGIFHEIQSNIIHDPWKNFHDPLKNVHGHEKFETH